MTYTSITDICRYLRKNQTEAEKVFWEAVRNRKVENKKFYRQYPIRINDRKPIKFFIADFFCFEMKLVVEIDGGIHETQKEYDALRTKFIERTERKVIRFKNEDVLNRLDWVIEKLKRHL